MLLFRINSYTILTGFNASTALVLRFMKNNYISKLEQKLYTFHLTLPYTMQYRDRIRNRKRVDNTESRFFGFAPDDASKSGKFKLRCGSDILRDDIASILNGDRFLEVR